MGRNRRGDRQVPETLYEAHTGRLSFNQTNNRQAQIERMYRRVLGELCMNRFKWVGWDGTGTNVRFLELLLYQHALAVVFKDVNRYGRDMQLKHVGTGQIYALRGGASGARNLVDDPTHFTVTGSNFNGRRLSSAECVPVWANYLRMPDTDIVDIYAPKLAQIDATIEINSLNARRSKILAFNENTQLTAVNINDMINRGEGAIPLNTQMGEMVSALDLGVDPKGIEVLSVIRARMWNEAMGLLGINNANQDKKERLVASEVDANDDQVESTRRVNLNARQEAAKLINDKFGLNVSVDYHSGSPAETVNPLTMEHTVIGGV